jgi:hypothetical protein
VRRTRRAHPSARVDRTTVSITCVVDGRAHQVPDLQLGTPEADGRGRYRALCGHVVTAAALAAPDGAPCPSCATA